MDVVVTLKLHQIQHTVNGTVPSDTSNCSVFEQPDVVRLTHRIKELEHEKALQKKQMMSGADSTGKGRVALWRDAASESGAGSDDEEGVHLGHGSMHAVLPSFA